MDDGDEQAAFRSVFVSAADGLRLHARDYGEATLGARRPSSACRDLRGRAPIFTSWRCASRPMRESRAASSPATCADAADPNTTRSPPITMSRSRPTTSSRSMAAMGVVKAAFVGASRGGLQMMVLAAMRPTVIAGGVLVDIGPVIEGKGLARIKGYVGKLPRVRDMEEATALLKRLGAAQFPAWSDAQWSLMARRSFRQTPSGLLPDYDPALAGTLGAIDLEAPLPTLWPFFEALAHAPLLAIRGGNSDILSRRDSLRDGAPPSRLRDRDDRGRGPCSRRRCAAPRLAHRRLHRKSGCLRRERIKVPRKKRDGASPREPCSGHARIQEKAPARGRGSSVRWRRRSERA